MDDAGPWVSNACSQGVQLVARWLRRYGRNDKEFRTPTIPSCTIHNPVRTTSYCNPFTCQGEQNHTVTTDQHHSTTTLLRLLPNRDNGTAFGNRGLCRIGHDWSYSAKPSSRSCAKQRHIRTPKEDRQNSMGHCSSSQHSQL